MYQLITINNTPMLHFSYSAAHLQNSIDELTSYLGANRASDTAPHQLDLVRMSKDDTSIFNRFGKIIMSDVYDNILTKAYNIEKKCAWKTTTNFTKITPLPQAAPPVQTWLNTEVGNSNKVKVSGDISYDQILDDRVYMLSMQVKVTCEIGTDVLGTGTPIRTTKEVVAPINVLKRTNEVISLGTKNNVDILKKYCQYGIEYTFGDKQTNTITDFETGEVPPSYALYYNEGTVVKYVKDNNGSYIVTDEVNGALMNVIYYPNMSYVAGAIDAYKDSYMLETVSVPVSLEPATGVLSGEYIISAHAEIVETRIIERNPITLKAGDTIDINGKKYIVNVDTNINDTNFANCISYHLDEEFTEGIHYYLTIHKNFDVSRSETLDVAIEDAITNGIIWKWLLIAYPNEAANYKALYDIAIDEMKTRCGIFKQITRLVPRII